MTEATDATMLRSRLFAGHIAQREDDNQRKIIESYDNPLDFTPVEELMISQGAWSHVVDMKISPQLVFAHPDILQASPEISAYYRGLALLSRKRVQQEAGSNVTTWENGERRGNIRPKHALSVARLYNAVISVIIEGKTNWSLENGYRNILATMGITLDGSYRNTIGDMAEQWVRRKIISWLENKKVISAEDSGQVVYSLSENTTMHFGSDPDIAFEKDGKLIATIEIKGGTDPAGGLERLGAMKKSFDETPSGCLNFLISGVITSTVQKRLDEIGIVKAYLLDDLMSDENAWNDFANEVFHHAVRVV